ncbi:MAG: ATP-dependent Clp protease adapter ClpS [bacterium]|nr:ATP-dependent Clp protease adapter ClpS [bacterium]
MSKTEKRTGGEVLERQREETQEPPMYRVLLHNDDYTPMEFVVDVLETVFDKSPAEAHRVMMHVHTRERGECGTYPFEVAETKVGQVHDLARVENHPLRASFEEA